MQIDNMGESYEINSPSGAVSRHWQRGECFNEHAALGQTLINVNDTCISEASRSK